MDELFNCYRMAVLDGLSKEYKDKWKAAKGDKEALVTLALGQRAIPYVADYLAKGKGIKREYLVREFGEYLNGYVIHDADGREGYTYAWYVDWDYDNDLVVDVNVVHITHTIGASVIVPKAKCPIIYASNRSDLHLVLEGCNTVILYVFDKTRVVVEDADEGSNVIVIRHGKEGVVEEGKFCFCHIKERE